MSNLQLLEGESDTAKEKINECEKQQTGPNEVQISKELRKSMTVTGGPVRQCEWVKQTHSWNPKIIGKLKEKYLEK